MSNPESIFFDFSDSSMTADGSWKFLPSGAEDYSRIQQNGSADKMQWLQTSSPAVLKNACRLFTVQHPGKYFSPMMDGGKNQYCREGVTAGVSRTDFHADFPLCGGIYVLPCFHMEKQSCHGKFLCRHTGELVIHPRSFPSDRVSEGTPTFSSCITGIENYSKQPSIGHCPSGRNCSRKEQYTETESPDSILRLLVKESFF